MLYAGQVLSFVAYVVTAHNHRAVRAPESGIVVVQGVEDSLDMRGGSAESFAVSGGGDQTRPRVGMSTIQAVLSLNG